ncbi:hypothetical protein RB599_006027 [Gaeumannomyces hyphopodioides]
MLQLLGGAAMAGSDVATDRLAESQGYILDGISIAFIVLTSVFIALRFWAKNFTVASVVFLDDLFLVAAYVVNLAMCALGLVMTRVGGVGHHVEYLERHDPAKLTGWAQCILAFELIYFVSMCLPKIAIVFLYLRVLNWKGPMRTLAFVVLGLLVATSLSFFLTACFQCQPIAFWWDKKLPGGGTCIDVQAFFHGQAIPGIILDVIIIAMPLQTVWELKLPVAKRIALVLIFAVGSFGIVASIIRAATFFNTSAFGDRTLASVQLVGWSIIETSTYIITNCMASMRPLLSRYAPAWLKSAARWTTSGGGGYGSGDKSGNRHQSRSNHRQKSQLQSDEFELTRPSTGYGSRTVIEGGVRRD